MADEPRISPQEAQEARAAARNGDKARRKAIEEALRAGWADDDATEANWLDEAARAHPGPSAAIGFLYGAVYRLVDRLAETTGEDREQIVRRALP